MTKTIHTFRTTARIIGAMYIAGFIVGIGGEMLIKSVIGVPNHLSITTASSMTVAIGALLWMLTAVWDAAHGILMFPILKLYNERIALGYLTFRIMDAIFIALMVLFYLLQLAVASEYLKAATSTAPYFQSLSAVIMQGSKFAYTIGMMTLGIAGLLLCYALYKATLIPRLLAIWGIVGYAIIFIGMASEIMNSGLGLASSLPGGLWELFIGFWLIIKGFNPSAFNKKISS